MDGMGRQGIQHSNLLLAGLLLSMSTLVSGSEGADRGNLTVELTGMASDSGSVAYAMWSGPQGWLVDGAVREGRVAIEQGSSMLLIEDLPYGEYAISAYHDQNDNGKLDTGLFRIPKEPIGTSNDAKIRFGPPKYKDARFRLDEPGLSITIQIRKLF